MGEQGAIVTEVLTTGSREQAGPRGTLREHPKGMSRGEERAAWLYQPFSAVKRSIPWFQSQRAASVVVVRVCPKPQDLRAHA